MEGTPPGLDLDELTEALVEVEGVIGVHHLRAWQLDERRRAVEAHVALRDVAVGPALEATRRGCGPYSANASGSRTSPSNLNGPEAQMADWFVYLLRCADGSLYAGITKDVPRRLAQHDAGTGAKYTRGRGPVALVEQAGPLLRGDALRLERALKRAPPRTESRLPPGPRRAKPVAGEPLKISRSGSLPSSSAMRASSARTRSSAASVLALSASFSARSALFRRARPPSQRARPLRRWVPRSRRPDRGRASGVGGPRSPRFETRPRGCPSAPDHRCFGATRGKLPSEARR